MEEVLHQERELTLVGIRLQPAGKIYDFDSGGLPLQLGDAVVVSTERGTALGTVVRGPWTVPRDGEPSRYQRILKKADARDLAREEANEERACEALRLCWKKVRERNLPMKLVRAEYALDGGRVVFYFVAEGRVDFRDLVRDLAGALHARVEMRQIGARDEAKFLGGVGPCGRELCCATWLAEFEPISLKMAKEQGLALNPAKLAGMCGRLKCCLRYEYETYVELGRGLPNLGKKVASAKGEGTVVRQNLLRQTVTLRLEDGVEVEVSAAELVGPKRT